MGVITTRRVADLQRECDEAGVEWSPEWGRAQYMDALRQHFGAFDATTEIDPMKAYDLKKHVAWDKTLEDGRYDGIAAYLNDSHVAEPKLDGVRMRLFLGLTGNTLNSGRRSVKTYAYTDRTDNFPQFRDVVVPELAGTILDCELLAPTPQLRTAGSKWKQPGDELEGVLTNSILNASVAITNCAPEKSQAVQAAYGPAVLHVFDVLSIPDVTSGDRPEDREPRDITGMSYKDRRVTLERIVAMLKREDPSIPLEAVPVWLAAPHVIDDAIAYGYEGVVLKNLYSTYQPGKRSKSAWLKVKTMSTADAFIVGYAPGEHANEGLVGSLDLAVLEPWDGTYEEFQEQINVHGVNFLNVGGGDKDGPRQMKIRPVAQVGNLGDALRREMTAKDGSLKPEWLGRTVEFMAQGIGKNGRARHAHMVRLRPDKDAEDCLVDQLDVFPAV